MENQEIEKLEKAIDGVKAKIQLQKSANQKLRNTLSEIEISKSTSMKEVQRLKDVNISLENSIKETKQVIEQQDSQETFNNLMNKLSEELFK